MEVNQFKSFYKTNGFLSFASPTAGFAASEALRSLERTLTAERPNPRSYIKNASDLMHKGIQAPITVNLWLVFWSPNLGTTQ